MTNTKPRMKPREAVAYLASIGCPYTLCTLEAWRCRGRGPRYFKVGRSVFYAPTDLDQFAAGTPVETTHEAN